MARRSGNPGVAVDWRAEWASWAPLVCAVHCLVAPVLVLVAPAFVHSGVIEGLVLTGAAVLAAVVVVAGTRIHGRKAPWALVATGVAIWCLVPLKLAMALPEPAVVVAGGLTMFGGMRWNARLKAVAEAGRCGCPACAESKDG
jgi:chromate transport protein ChrA